MTKDKEKGLRVYRKLFGFYNSGIAIHFNLQSGGDAGKWRNGKILVLDIKSLSMVLKEFTLGERPYLLEELNEYSISAFRPKEEKKE